MPFQTVNSYWCAWLQCHLTAHHTILEYSVALLWVCGRCHCVSRCLQWQFILWTVIFTAKLWHLARDHSWTSIHFSFPIFGRFSQNCEKWKVSSCLSAWNNSAPTGCIFMKFDIWAFFENLFRKFEFHYNLTTITGTLHEDRYTFLIISRSVLFRMGNVSNIICREKQNTHFVFSNFFFENRSVHEIIYKNIVKPDRPQMTI